MAKKIPGANAEDEPEDLLDMVELDRNRTVIAMPVNPMTAGEDDEVQVFKADSLAAVAKQVQPTVSYTLKVTSATGKIDEVDAEMSFGRDNPDEVLDDFRPERVIIKSIRSGSDKDPNQIKRRPLLAMRLESAAISDLLKELADPKSKIGKAIKDAAKRKLVLTAIRERIQTLEAEAKKVQDERTLEDADSEEITLEDD